MHAKVRPPDRVPHHESEAKGYPFEVLLPAGLPVSGVILSDQLRSLDWRARDVSLIGPAPVDVVAEVLAKATTLLSP